MKLKPFRSNEPSLDKYNYLAWNAKRQGFKKATILTKENFDNSNLSKSGSAPAIKSLLLEDLKSDFKVGDTIFMDASYRGQGIIFKIKRIFLSSTLNDRVFSSYKKLMGDGEFAYEGKLCYEAEVIRTSKFYEMRRKKGRYLDSIADRVNMRDYQLQVGMARVLSLEEIRDLLNRHPHTKIFME